jgi:hypothetical protein
MALVRTETPVAAYWLRDDGLAAVFLVVRVLLQETLASIA